MDSTDSRISPAMFKSKVSDSKNDFPYPERTFFPENDTENEFDDFFLNAAEQKMNVTRQLAADLTGNSDSTVSC